MIKSSLPPVFRRGSGVDDEDESLGEEDDDVPKPDNCAANPVKPGPSHSDIL